MVFLMLNVLILLQEAANNKNGRAPHSEWRNYDDFNEFFWYKQINQVTFVSRFVYISHNLLTVSSRSHKCFNLGWPWKLSDPFFSKPSRKDKVVFFYINHNHNYFDLSVSVTKSVFVYL